MIGGRSASAAGLSSTELIFSSSLNEQSSLTTPTSSASRQGLGCLDDRPTVTNRSPKPLGFAGLRVNERNEDVRVVPAAMRGADRAMTAYELSRLQQPPYRGCSANYRTPVPSHCLNRLSRITPLCRAS